MDDPRIVLSIVLYHNSFDDIADLIGAIRHCCPQAHICCWDNSSLPMPDRDRLTGQGVEYLHEGKNLGFGNGHNAVFRRYRDRADYFVVLNPDIEYIDGGAVITGLVQYLEAHPEVALVSPKLLNQDGSVQQICRYDPTLLAFTLRRAHIDRRYGDIDCNLLTSPVAIPFIHGAFFVIRIKDIETADLFDPRYFMYLEDADICRDLRRRGKHVIYHPGYAVVHGHKQGSYKTLRLFTHHTVSALRYLAKWPRK